MLVTDWLIMEKSLFVFLNILVTQLNADVSFKDIKGHTRVTTLSYNDKENNLLQDTCAVMLEDFAHSASALSFCSIRYSRPITLCEKCIDEYVEFHDKYQELLTKVINGTSCGSRYMSQDRLNVVMDYHDNIAAVWTKGNCKSCYDWDDAPTLKNDTITFNKMYKDTWTCITDSNISDNEKCDKCFESYIQLDTFYKTLSTDGIGVESICMDIVDSMNATRSKWSKELNCCNLRRKPEIAFLCCASIISVLPLFYYVAVRFCGPIRDLPNVLKQSRFKQTILREVEPIND